MQMKILNVFTGSIESKLDPSTDTLNSQDVEKG